MSGTDKARHIDQLSQNRDIYSIELDNVTSEEIKTSQNFNFMRYNYAYFCTKLIKINYYQYEKA